MRLGFRLLVVLLFLNCSNERTLILPEIPNAKVTEVLDVSAAYIFYDESQEDSTLLNRKNLISTTNWLVNVDRRLKLRQAIPHIKFLLDKKRNAKMHKNEDAKNYFSCNNLNTKNLGFIEFTKVYFKEENPDYVSFSTANPSNYVIVRAFSDQTIKLIQIDGDFRTEIPAQFSISKIEKLADYLNSADMKNIVLSLDYGLTFQDYITIKHFFTIEMNPNVEISENEYLFP